MQHTYSHLPFHNAPLVWELTFSFMLQFLVEISCSDQTAFLPGIFLKLSTRALSLKRLNFDSSKLGSP